MLGLLLLAFVAVPIIEIWVIVEVGGAIGYGSTLGLVVLVSLVGAWLTKHEGFVTLRRIREQLERGRLPGNELVDGFLILGGGLLLLTPGFVTDGIGLTALFPPTRALLRTFVRRRLRIRIDYSGPDRREPPDDVVDV